MGTWKTLGVRKGLDRIALVLLRADWDVGCLETWKEGRLEIGKSEEMWNDTKARFWHYKI